MTTGQFWNGVTILMAVYDGRVVAGPMSLNWTKREQRRPFEIWPLGLACEFVLQNPKDYDEITSAALVLNIQIQKTFQDTEIYRFTPI